MKLISFTGETEAIICNMALQPEGESQESSL